MKTILGRTILSFMAFILLLVGILATTIMVTGQQKDDGLIVNLSGRQRMLSQKMTKETLIFYNMARQESRSEANRWKEQVISTMKVFEVTLYALKDGGDAPLDLKMASFRNAPPAGTEEIKQQLDKVVALWLPIKQNITQVLDSAGKDETAMEFVIANNVNLLSNMNEAVFLMQYDAERKVQLMVITQVVAIGIGILIVILSLMVIRASVVAPIKSLIESAKLMSKGDLQSEIKSSGLAEIAELSSSLNRMRISFIKIMDMVNKG
jgi:methyl-accepting chemotaxis protein